MYRDDLPNRVRAVVLGGGIHGVAVLHDLVSRGWRDVILLEKNRLGSGASCRTLKFAPLAAGSSEAWTMADARLLAKEGPAVAALAPDMCTYEFCNWRLENRWQRWGARVGARVLGYGRHSRLSSDGIEIAGYRFDDLGLVRRVARSARKLGAQIRESCTVDRIDTDDDGWIITGKNESGEPFKLGALYVVNCAGQNANTLLENSGIRPDYTPTYISEIYLLVNAPEFARALVWRAPNHYPGFNFAIPWKKMVIVGPWRFESDQSYNAAAGDIVSKGLDRLSKDVEQLGLAREAIITGFVRNRLFADPASANLLSWAPRSLIGEMQGKRGSLFTLYGGVFLGFRQYAREIGDRIMVRFGEKRPSLTDMQTAWLKPEDDVSDDVYLRFQPGGVAHDRIVLP